MLALSVFTCAASAQSINIEVLSATVKDKKIDDAAVILQKNGAQSVTARSDAAGRVALNAPFAVDQDSLLIIKKEGYSDLVVKCPCDGMTYAISPVMKNLDGMRIVLTWGERPFDLDSHLIYPDNHIYFQHKKGRDANLDVDDTDSFGPETITIDKKRLGESYIYAVHDYTNGDKTNSPALSASSAKVFVYVGSSLVRTYSVPLNKTGNIWTVFRLNPNGDFEDINAVGEADFSKAKDGNALPMVLNPAQTATSVTGNTELAKTLNRDGEAAYGRGELEQATTLFLAAIEQDSAFGQAYSNLGLAYQKRGNIAEAIWANRKAIALANGSNAATTRASSYYNIAKIYENAGQFSDALQHYELARSQKSNTVYDKAIERMKAKM
ncbi:tetratricopeptide repeat protein [Pectobacterium aroidearum]|uniref:Tetratricopeptide repeat protein n=2 Tax=Pectobacteriaceae TaxID=1903410 RepID=A0ABR5ZCX5_9GAMM|nr:MULTISPECIES: tetratricopeptide repeat protein [Pectobacterium]MBA5199646.1 tetratricopeptide repeat protein [Pectobacterium aroidearum]MBA5228362.1 tetratricopeptide repeat protein [Pectobacterium aroidearum]MBA5232438.1 tetratricopeptide repeat protein [Pectobacterium aroidearum]MBA5737886.1 tetratricopeptide repeat protein [Pectobacterium aroidearum]UXK02506.1 tetratricopeptide repeat protein [Pectobacterium aroidearum]